MVAGPPPWSPSWYEGLGLPALEALASGTPVVASDLPAHREVLGDQAITPPATRPPWPPPWPGSRRPGGAPARAARRARAAGFTWETCAQATLSAYRLALESAGDRDPARRGAGGGAGSGGRGWAVPGWGWPSSCRGLSPAGSAATCGPWPATCRWRRPSTGARSSSWSPATRLTGCPPSTHGGYLLAGRDGWSLRPG